jgi:hypothetical protein
LDQFIEKRVLFHGKSIKQKKDRINEKNRATGKETKGVF